MQSEEMLEEVKRLVQDALADNPDAIPTSISPGMKLAKMDLKKASQEGIGNWVLVNLTLEFMRRGASFQAANELAEGVMFREYKDLWQPGASRRETQRRRNMAADYVVATQLLQEQSDPPASVVSGDLLEAYGLIEDPPLKILRAAAPTGELYVGGWPRPVEPAVVYSATENI